MKTLPGYFDHPSLSKFSSNINWCQFLPSSEQLPPHASASLVSSWKHSALLFLLSAICARPPLPTAGLQHALTDLPPPPGTTAGLRRTSDFFSHGDHLGACLLQPQVGLLVEERA